MWLNPQRNTFSGYIKKKGEEITEHTADETPFQLRFFTSLSAINWRIERLNPLENTIPKSLGSKRNKRDFHACSFVSTKRLLSANKMDWNRKSNAQTPKTINLSEGVEMGLCEWRDLAVSYEGRFSLSTRDCKHNVLCKCLKRLQTFVHYIRNHFVRSIQIHVVRITINQTVQYSIDSTCYEDDQLIPLLISLVYMSLLSTNIPTTISLAIKYRSRQYEFIVQRNEWIWVRVMQLWWLPIGFLLSISKFLNSQILKLSLRWGDY